MIQYFRHNVYLKHIDIDIDTKNLHSNQCDQNKYREMGKQIDCSSNHTIKAALTRVAQAKHVSTENMLITFFPQLLLDLKTKKTFF